MSLPKIVAPEYTVQLKSVKKPVRYRPYLVKEEKLFMTAKESNDPKDVEHAVVQVLKNCTFGEIDVEALPSFDLEYLFLKLRAQSVAPTVELNYECRNTVGAADTANADARCRNRVTVAVPLDAIELTQTDGHTDLVTLQSGMILKMRYPSIALTRKHNIGEASAGATEFLADCIETVTDTEGNVYEMRDYSEQERIEFVESFGVLDMQKFQTFFETMPALRHVIPFACKKCGYSEMITLEGLQAFF
jgi:hypothetical protein